MGRKLAEHLSYANVMATIAVFIAVGGGAYAATLAKDSVGSKQIKAKAVKKSELADDAVNSAKVADESLRGEDFAPGQGPPGMFAVVNANGSLTYGSGATGASRFATGEYDVTFDRSLSDCAAVATAGLGDRSAPGDTTQPGSTATVELSPSITGLVKVNTAAAATAGEKADRSFVVAVFC